MRPVWLIVAMALLFGIIYSVRDYRKWRYEETARFGQGSPEEAGILPAQELDLPFTSEFARFRLKPPAGWVVTENPAYTQLEAGTPIPVTRVEIVRFEKQDGSASIRVYIQKTDLGLTDAAGLEDEGITRDRQYFSSPNTSLTVLTWDDEGRFVQKALTVGHGTLAVIEATSSLASWKDVVRTFETVYQSWVWI